MFKAALFGLMAAWVAWGYPFASNMTRMSRSEADIAVTAPAAKRGMLLQAIGYFCIFSYRPGPRPAALMAAALLLEALAVVTAWTGVRALGRQWRMQAGLYRDHVLVREGPYRIVRHPIYASMLAMFLATALVLSIWQFALPALIVFLAGIEVRVRVEDGLLAARFGKQFDEYKARVRAYVPLVR